MIETIATEEQPDVWTRFMDMHSGGGTKTPYEQVYVQAPEAEARRIFAARLGADPGGSACSCCGEDFSISEYDTLREATAYDRHVVVEDGVELWLHRNSKYITDETGWAKQVGQTEYCLRPNVLVIYTREV